MVRLVRFLPVALALPVAESTRSVNTTCAVSCSVPTSLPSVSAFAMPSVSAPLWFSTNAPFSHRISTSSVPRW